MNKVLSSITQKKRNRLSVRIVVAVLLCSSALTLVTTAFQLYFDYQKDVKAIHSNIQFIQDSYLPAIISSVYTLDEKQVKTLLEGTLNIPDIEYMEIKDVLNNPFKSAGNPAASKDVTQIFPLDFITPSGKMISVGTLSVSASLEGIYHRLLEKAYVILLSNMVKTFFASILILMIINHIVVRHLIRISNFTRHLSLDELGQELTLNRKESESTKSDELAQLVQSINEMLVNIKDDTDKIRDMGQALRESEKKLRIRNRIANIFLTISDDKMYGEILGMVLKAMKSKYGVFGYIDENGALVCPSMTRNIWDQCQIPEKDIVFPRDTWGGIWGKALIEKTARYSNEPFKVPEGHVPITRALDVPIIYQGEVIGNLLVGNKETNYVESDQDLLEEISEYIAPVLSARLQRDKEEKDRKNVEKDLRKSEEKLARSEKMEAMGLMAGGVAHDLNNILSGIVSYPELLLLDLPEDSPLRNPIKTIQESGMRAADVVEDLLTIARGVASGKEILNLNTMVEEYISSAEHQKLEKVHPMNTFKTELDSELLNITGSASHVKKILMNLTVNASEAIEGSGTVTISTTNQYLDEPLKGYEDVRIGEYVMLTVSDDGSGISPQDLDKIFEPFYTKKVMGRSGTGLGLAVVWNTVQDHKGYINVRTSEKGTVFELYFPVTREEVADEGEQVPLDDYLGHGEKILVVDDEERQREIASGILTRLGYNAETVSSGEEAIEFVKENPVDLILLDMVMPKGINGRKTYEEVIKIRPGQKAIIASGYAKTKEVDKAQELGAGKYIKKPYTLAKVGVAVKEELEK